MSTILKALDRVEERKGTSPERDPLRDDVPLATHTETIPASMAPAPRAFGTRPWVWALVALAVLAVGWGGSSFIRTRSGGSEAPLAAATDRDAEAIGRERPALEAPAATPAAVSAPAPSQDQGFAPLPPPVYEEVPALAAEAFAAEPAPRLTEAVRSTEASPAVAQDSTLAAARLDPPPSPGAVLEAATPFDAAPDAATPLVAALDPPPLDLSSDAPPTIVANDAVPDPNWSPPRPAVSAPPPVRSPEPAVSIPRPEPAVVIPPPPDVAVLKTAWHPDATRRSARIEVEGFDETLNLREGDAVGTLVVVSIEPSAVVFLHGGREVRHAVGVSSR